MNPFNVITILILVLIISISLVIILYKHYCEKLELLNYKLKNSEDEFKNKLKEKYNLIIRFIDLVENKYKIDSKTFQNVKNIELDDINNQDNDKLLNKCYKELKEIKEDNQKNKELKNFREIINDYEKNEVYIISLRTYYNKNVLEYNNTIKKFPYNIISIIKKLKIKNLFEGKELELNQMINKEV